LASLVTPRTADGTVNSNQTRRQLCFVYNECNKAQCLFLTGRYIASWP